MPKIFALRHQLAEQQARLTGDVKNRLSPLQDEVKHTHKLCVSYHNGKSKKQPFMV